MNIIYIIIAFFGFTSSFLFLVIMITLPFYKLFKYLIGKRKMTHKEEFSKKLTEIHETLRIYNNMLSVVTDGYIQKYKKFNEDDPVIYKDKEYYIADDIPGVDKYGNLLYDIYYWDKNDEACYEFTIDQDNLILNEK